jgi:integrase/recombinase XerD
MSTQFISKFYTYLLTEKMCAANTFSAYKRDVDQFIGYLNNQSVSLQDVSSKNIKQYIKYLKEELHLSPRSITRKISALKVLFTYLHDHHHMVNSASDLTFPKLDKKLPDYLTEQEIKQLLMATELDTSAIGVRNKLIIYLLYGTGVRISELISLRVSQVHFDTHFIDVQGKGGKSRTVPVPQEIFSLLTAYLENIHPVFTENGKLPTDYLFPIFYRRSLKAITRQAVWNMIKELCKKSGIDRSIYPHQLRHSLATHLLKGGVDLRSLQLLLGHENLSTVQIYTHVETSYLRSIYDKKHPRS